ncbi:MAG: phage holin family protein [Actinomycetota bacterium]|nr:phage holin family protein [Actinomycetota bacterium]
MAGGDDEHESLPEQAQDLFHLVIAYAKQETLDPIKGLGRFLAWGMAGAVVGSLGVVLLLLGALRLLQTETGSTFQGKLTWIPYLLVVIVCAAIAGGALKARSRGQRRAT